MIVYRTAEAADFEQIYAIWSSGTEKTLKGVSKSDSVRSEFFELFENRTTYGFWVAVAEDVVIAFQSFLPISANPLKANYIVESSTYVSAEHLNSGVGYRLLSKSLGLLECYDVAAVCAFIAVENETALRMALKLGFENKASIPAMGAHSAKYFFLRPLN